MGFGSGSYDLDLGGGESVPLAVVAVSPALQGFHPATVRGAEEGAPQPAHSNPRMFGGATHALGPLR